MFGIGEVLASCGLIVHESINVYLSFSDTFESVMKPLSSICSGVLLKLYLYSSFLDRTDYHSSRDLVDSVGRRIVARYRVFLVKVETV